MRLPLPTRRRDLHALADAYALDALEPAERDRFERHLRGCRTCPDEVRGFAATAAALATAAAAQPPRSLRDRVFAAVDELSVAKAQDTSIAAVLAAPDARIASAGTSAGGTATVVASLRERAIVFTSAGLRALPPTHVYELWFIGSGGARPAGLVPDATGGSTLAILAAGFAADDRVGVTVEPAGGTDSPTTTPIVVLAAA